MEKRHYAVIDPFQRRITLSYKGNPIVITEKALILKEVGKTVYNPVFYIPKEDIIINLIAETFRESNCPIKGDATYWNIDVPTKEYFAWSYEEPMPRTKKIKGYVAFNLNHLTFHSEPI